MAGGRQLNRISASCSDSQHRRTRVRHWLRAVRLGLMMSQATLKPACRAAATCNTMRSEARQAREMCIPTLNGPQEGTTRMQLKEHKAPAAEH